jgi:hypothetical protein
MAERGAFRNRATVACALLLLAGVVAAGMTFGRRCEEWDGYNVPREIQVSFQDADGQPLRGVTVERVVVRPGLDAAPTDPWNWVDAESDDAGVLLFGIGGTGASGGSCSYFWGLRTTTRRDDPLFGYRFLLEGREIGWFTADELQQAPADAQTPLPESLFAALEYPEAFGIRSGAGVERVALTVTIR